jgi:biopolymer transport protein ExbD
MIEFERPKPLTPLNIAPTSMIDIIFLLLLFFLLTSVFSEDLGIPLDLPQAATAEPPQERPEEVIYISKTGEIYMNGQSVPLDNLFMELSKAETGKPITIKADKEVAFGIFVRVLDIAKAVGGQNVVIAAEIPQ